MKNKYSLIAVNSKYIHSNLAVRYIRNFCKNSIENLEILEYSINDHFDNIVKDIVLNSGNVLAFSCYIWNIEYILKLCSSLKIINPDYTIILGGPEVSFDKENIMYSYEYIDYIIDGEGEITFLELVNQIENECKCIDQVMNLTYRQGKKVISNSPRPLIKKLDDIPFPYENIEDMQNKIIYYETTRGCPFSCQYCLSSTIHGVRYLSFERIKSDIDFFIDNNVRQVKLVDRTFNCNKEHALQIIRYIIEKNSKTNFHFEISADLLDDEFIDTLARAPKGMFQLEIGIQSTNIETLNEIKRVTNFKTLSSNVKRLLEANNMHIHLDLIAGLPYEDFNSFSKSFNEVYALKPHMLQLGFLKLLRGSGIRNKSQHYGIKFYPHPPYEVISTNWISFNEIILLKDIEVLVEYYYNSGKFNKSIVYIINKHYISPFDFYKAFSLHWNRNGYYSSPKSLIDQYNILIDYYIDQFGNDILFNELVKYDFILNNKNMVIPSKLKRFDMTMVKDKIQNALKNNTLLLKYFPELQGMSLKDILKHLSYEVFYVDVTSKDYTENETVIFFINSKKEKKVVGIALHDL